MPSLATVLLLIHGQVAFYWALEAPRRLLLKVAVLTCTVVLGFGSEVLQSFLPNGRPFDLLDIVANVVGSSLALAICTWYHGRMLERKRKRKLEGYGLLGPGEEEGDLELGDGGGSGQETGVVDDNDDTGEAWDEIDDVSASEVAVGKAARPE